MNLRTDDMRVIGLTGSIGSGKSTVSDYLKRKGYFLIDSDELSREVVMRGKSALKELVAAFGTKILTEDGELDRKRLAEIAFKSKQKKALLEEIVTARIIKEIKLILRKLKKEGARGPIFIDAPILFESKAKLPIDAVLVVVADDDIRAKRVMARDDCGYGEFKRRDELQLSQEEKIARADWVIDNSGTTRKLYYQIRKVLKEIDAGI